MHSLIVIIVLLIRFLISVILSIICVVSAGTFIAPKAVIIIIINAQLLLTN